MNCFRFLPLLAFILLCSCGDSTNPQENQGPTAIDYLFAGNPGSQIQYTIAFTETDSNGIKPTLMDTVTWTVLDRNFSHPIWGNCVKMHQFARGQNNPKGFGIDYYFGLYNNSLYLFPSLTDSLGIITMKNPLTIGNHWIDKGNPNFESDKECTIQEIDVPILTTYKTLNTIRIDSKDTLFRSTGNIVENSKEYYAQGLFLVHSERTSNNIKTNVQSLSIIDLIRYTKK
ncbi:MAG: hypothetical protein HYZ54_07610 [Ignavibacteriae bacterium]|nr:hypothetical protein [Ignavibacteriota bacterium]